MTTTDNRQPKRPSSEFLDGFAEGMRRGLALADPCGAPDADDDACPAPLEDGRRPLSGAPGGRRPPSTLAAGDDGER